MSLLLLDVVVIECSGLGLFHLVGQSEVGLASLLWRYDLDVVHADLVHSVIVLSSIYI